MEEIVEMADEPVARDFTWKERFEVIASEVCERESVQLYDWELTGVGGSRILRVYIDRAGASIGIEDCSNVSKGLNLLLDVEDLIPGGSYHLEVSSPGLERVLKRRAHFQAAIGKRVYIKTFSPLCDWLDLGSIGRVDGQAQGTSSGASSESHPKLNLKAKSFDGKLVSIDEMMTESIREKDSSEGFLIAVAVENGQVVHIPRSQIAKANLVFEMNSSGLKRK